MLELLAVLLLSFIVIVVAVFVGDYRNQKNDYEENLTDSERDSPGLDERNNATFDYSRDLGSGMEKVQDLHRKIERRKDVEEQERQDIFRGYYEARTKKREIMSDAYRKFYGLASDVKLYYDYYEYTGMISSIVTVGTPHELMILKDIISYKYFDPRCVFLDSYIRDRNGKIAQIDLIAVNRKGVFVFESKDYSGWIFGNGSQQMWTQVFYNDKFRFYNPIRQNNKHVDSIKSRMGDSKLKFYSIIVFGENAELKNVSFVPKDSFVVTSRRLNDALTEIMEAQSDSLSWAEIVSICRTIDKDRLKVDEKLRRDHVEEIRERIGTDRVYD